MRAFKGVLIVSMIMAGSLSCQSQNVQSCPTNWYGSQEDRLRTQMAMFTGDVSDVIAAINQAKMTRGLELGCPQVDYGPRQTADISKPTLSEIVALWNRLYQPFLDSYTIGCPKIGRAEPSLALGAYYASHAGHYNNLASLANIAKMVEAQQYSAKYAPLPLVAEAGIYGYFSGDVPTQCAIEGVAGSLTSSLCAVRADLCITYQDGIYEGLQFAIRDNVIMDINAEILIEDLVIGDIGGAAFDMGWSTVQMIEAAIESPLEADRILFQQSALLAGEWALEQPLVTNTNYTSKITWILAELYAWTGREDFKIGLIDRIERNLKPAVLMDFDENGIVDGTDIAFQDLHPIAKLPGRNYDGHNELPWYHSMNTWAAIEAYVAFRDNGDLEQASQIRPYVIAMLDNLAHEIVNLGLPGTMGPDTRDTPYSILLGIWKIAQYEGETHPLWEQAAWAFWNQGIFERIGPRGLNLGLYMLILQETPYIPLSQRQNVVTEADLILEQSEKVSFFPNPVSQKATIHLPAQIINYQIHVIDTAGKLWELNSSKGKRSLELDFSNVPSGVYLIRITSNSRSSLTRVVKE